MKKKLVIGNWKAHGSRDSMTAFLSSLSVSRGLQRPEARVVFSNDVRAVAASVEVVLVPPFVYLQQTAAAIVALDGLDVMALGAQDVSTHDVGAYTGEIPASMLHDVGCRYGLVGHSECRLAGDTDLMIAEKFKQLQVAGLVPVLCVGETRAQKEGGGTLSVIQRQLETVLQSIDCRALVSLIVAYEPVWAIGSGVTPTNAEIAEVSLFVCDFLQGFGVKKHALRVLYGGSVTTANASVFLQAPIDGVLIGGASLDALTFLRICQVWQTP